MEAYQRILEALEVRGKTVKDSGKNSAIAQCTSHNDGRPSLSIRGIQGSVLLYCMAGCSTDDVVSSLGLTMADLFDDQGGFTYEYPGGRMVRRTPEKDFKQFGNKTDTSLYRSDRIVGVGPIFVCEGEKDVLAIEAAGGQAVSASGGVNNALNKFDWEPLRGKIVHVVTDRDVPGQKRAREVVEYLSTVAMSVSLYEPLVGKDAADHVAAGYDLTQFKCLSAPEVLSFSQALDAWHHWRNSEHVNPIPTPWRALNEKIAGGLHPGRLYVIGARTGNGKTVAGVNVITHAAELGHTALIVSVEMPHVEITSRILSSQARVSYDSITRRQFDDVQVGIDQYIADRREMPLYICDKATITIEEVALKCRMLRDSRGLEAAFLDYAQLIKASNRSVSRQEQVSHIARSAKLLAMELNIPVVLAAQLNRGAEEETNGEVRLPKMTDLRESGELEQSADVILLLHRVPQTGQTYIVVPKNRTGVTGQVVLTTRFDMARFDS